MCKLGKTRSPSFVRRLISPKKRSALVDFGFSELKLRKIIIRCATGNTLSQGIPKYENLYGRLVDHYEYETKKNFYSYSLYIARKT